MHWIPNAATVWMIHVSAAAISGVLVGDGQAGGDVVTYATATLLGITAGFGAWKTALALAVMLRLCRACRHGASLEATA